LLALARDGHERAFDVLVQRYRRPLLAYCHRMPVPAATAEDVVQQGLLQAWVALQRGADVRDARPWLYRIVHNAALGMRTASRNDHTELSEALVGAGPPQSELERRMRVRATLADVAALPPLQREALMRTAVEGLSHEQVATMLGLSDAAVRGLVYRARTSLRNAAAAFSPLPFVKWMVRAGRKGAQFGAGTAGHGGWGAAAGVGAVVKGSAAVTVGAFVVGAAVMHPQRAAHERQLHAPSARRVSAPPPAPRGKANSVAGGTAVGDVSYVSTAVAAKRGGDRRASGGATSPISNGATGSVTNSSSGNGGGATKTPSSSGGGGSDSAANSSSGEGGDAATTPTSSGAGGSATSPSSGDGVDAVATAPSSGANEAPPASSAGTDSADSADSADSPPSEPAATTPGD
jgi:RNA polymerase sigma factor (sigma-70 family)